MDNYNYISAEGYAQIVRAMYGNAGKKVVCERLRISRPTHDKWLKRGIRNKDQVRRIRNLVGTRITDLRSRARSLDRWTTSAVYTEIKRIGYTPISDNVIEEASK